MLRSLLLLALVATSLGAAEAGALRVRTTINEQWRFAPGEIEGADQPAFDDSSWSVVDLPHTWNGVDAFDEEPGYRRGAGWYRKRLELDAALRGRRLYLYFEGANQVADVWVNGARAGRHAGGYTAFVFDVTDLVAWKRENVVAVRVTNEHDPDVPPLNGDFTFYGGIYRDVWLLATAPIHVSVTNHASPGVFAAATALSRESAIVRVSGAVANDTAAAVRVRVVASVVAAAGSVVASGERITHVPAGRESAFDLTLPSIGNPRLWSPADPYLYRVRADVFHGHELVDRIEIPLGLRWVEVDPRRGFLLNGEQLKLVGTNRHQDAAGHGNALADAHHRRDVRIVKETGFNFLRLAHYPQDPAVLEEADRLGLLVWEEIPIVNLIGTSDAFAANSERMLIEMIRQHHRHPSIVFWGTMNEVMLTRPKPVPPGYYERIAELAKRLDARARAEDPTRRTVLALSRDEVPPDDHGVASIPEALGLNLYFGWYYERCETLGPFLDAFHRRYPDRPLIISEYGAGSDERVHAAAPAAFDFSTEYHQRFHEESFPQIEARDWLVGSAVWNQFDFGSELRSDSKPTLNQKGLHFFDREPKDAAFYYRAALGADPVLRIGREWSVRAGSRPEDRMQEVRIYTNLEEPIVFVNGRTTGVSAVRNRAVRLRALLDDGDNEIRVAARRGDAWFTDVATIRYDDRASRFADPAAPGIVAAVDAGSDSSFVDDAGIVWEADRSFIAGSWGVDGGVVARTPLRIRSTNDDPLFQSVREAAKAYRFDLPDGTYEVEIGLVEPKGDARPGERVFDLLVNGVTIFAGLDLAADPGPLTALRRKTVVQASDGSGVVVTFVPRAGKSLVAAILVRR